MIPEIAFVSGHRDLTELEFEENYIPAINDFVEATDEYQDVPEIVVGDCAGCDEMTIHFIKDLIIERFQEFGDEAYLNLTIYHMFDEPRVRVGTLCEDGKWRIDVNTPDATEDDYIKWQDWPVVRYRGGFESDVERDEAMTKDSEIDIAFIRDKTKWKSGTAQNIIRRHMLKS